MYWAGARRPRVCLSIDSMDTSQEACASVYLAWWNLFWRSFEWVPLFRSVSKRGWVD